MNQIEPDIINNDKAVLENILAVYDIAYYQKAVALIGVDENFTVQYISKPFIKKLELIKPWKELVGFPALNLIALIRPNEAVDKAENILKKVLISDSEYETIAINTSRKPENSILRYKLTPLHNRYTGNVIAIEISVSVYTPFSLLYDNGILFDDGHGQTNTIIKQMINLSTRESEVLFLNCYCKSAKEVAAILSRRYNKDISLHSINTINRRLYVKFDVYNLEALIEMAYKCGYHMKIPTSLLTDNVINLGL